jgi:hypothetical protein
MIRSIKILLLLIAILFSVTTQAQKAKSEAKVLISADSLHRQIGQQVVLTIKVQAPASQKVSWPNVPDTLGQVEVLKRSAVDTTRGSEKNMKSYSQKLTVTSFDTGTIIFPKLPFRTGSGNDTTIIFSDSVQMQYASVPVDTTKSIKEIKGIMAAPLTVGEIMPWVLGVMIFGAVAIIVYTFYLHKKSKKPLIVFKPKPEIPAHILALEALNHLKDEAIWKRGRFKEYYTGLTDILRNYMEKRYGVMAQEMTSDEILEALEGQTNDGLMSRLRNLFSTADLVKFAKGIPETHEIEVNLDVAYDFVENTKLIAVVSSTTVDAAKTTVTTTNPLTIKQTDNV